MIHIDDIQPLSAFQRNAKRYLSRVNKTGKPQVLTVNGKAEAVLLGRTAYAKMLDAMEELATIKSVQISLKQMTSGQTVSAKAVHQRLRELWATRSSTPPMRRVSWRRLSMDQKACSSFSQPLA